jgi:uncharacterized membrane protein
VAFKDAMEHVAQAFEVFGAFVLALGLVWSIVLAGRTLLSVGGRRAYRTLRETFGGVLLLGLEILVAADLIHTIAVAPTLQNLGGLGLIVLVRTFLSFSLETEIEGVPPWRRALVSGATVASQASHRAAQSGTDRDR